ncbi:hypothetical protein ES705_00046 [subsurface metagenome]|nr:hypothetical protein [Clostridia bacterium]
MKNQIIIKILAAIIITAFILLFAPIVSSCTHKLSFGDLTICGEIDMVTFAPLEIRNSFDVGVEKIFATVRVSGTKAEDIWEFTWINVNTGEIIADSTGRYLEEGSGYIEGYLSNYIVPAQEWGIIGEPGNYRVDFYHNSQLISSAGFIIESLELEITGVVLSSEIDEASQPTAVTESFYPDDIIYTLLRLNCQIEGETVGVKWYRGENELLGEKEFTVDKNYYLPDYIVFMITNDELWPVDSYRVEVFHNGLLDDEYCFKVVEKEVPDATFSPGNVYQNEEYKFSVCYPDDWKSEEKSEEKKSEAGLEVDFIPAYDNINVIIYMRVLKEGHFPSEENYSNFSDQLLNGLVASNDTPEVEKSESTGEIGDVTYRQINYHYPGEDKDGWDVDLIFINRSNMLYLFLKVSDVYHKRFADKVYKSMLDSLSFD